MKLTYVTFVRHPCETQEKMLCCNLNLPNHLWAKCVRCVNVGFNGRLRLSCGICVIVFFAVLTVGNHSYAVEEHRSIPERFERAKILLDRRVEIGLVSPAAVTAWAKLATESEKFGRLFSLHEFASFLSETSSGLDAEDYGCIQSLYLSLQDVPLKWAEVVEEHSKRGEVAQPASYKFKVTYSEFPSITHLQAFHDGKNCSLAITKYVNDEPALYGTMATDGERLMRFQREGYRCNEPIGIPSVIWRADITAFQGYQEAIRTDDPLLQYYPDRFQSVYGICGMVEPIAEIADASGIWEETADFNGKTVFFCGTPFTYVAFDTKTGDLLAYFQGEYSFSNGSLCTVESSGRNSVVFKSHELFDKVGRLPTSTVISTGTSVTTVKLLSISQAPAADDGIVEESIPLNAYVLDRINEVKYVNSGEEKKPAGN